LHLAPCAGVWVCAFRETSTKVEDIAKAILKMG
jgi:hypothetical protein